MAMTSATRGGVCDSSVGFGCMCTAVVGAGGDEQAITALAGRSAVRGAC